MSRSHLIGMTNRVAQLLIILLHFSNRLIYISNMNIYLLFVKIVMDGIRIVECVFF
jgi:hypothetical protein